MIKVSGGKTCRLCGRTDFHLHPREDDYRPGAPCMECGEYPGPRHERSDCSRAKPRK